MLEEYIIEEQCLQLSDIEINGDRRRNQYIPIINQEETIGNGWREWWQYWCESVQSRDNRIECEGWIECWEDIQNDIEE